MSIILKLGYIDLSVTNAEDSIRYFNDVLGAVTAETAGCGAVYLGLDADHHCLVVRQSDQPALGAVGVQLRPPTTLGDATKRLQALGLSVQAKSDSRPGVADLIEVTVAGGPVFEIYESMAPSTAGFSNRGISPERLGHIAILSTDAKRVISFLRDGLGCWPTDRFDDRVTFLTCNRDHHVFNVVDAPVSRLHHVAFQLHDASHHFEACDRLAIADIPVLWGPSRHTAGHNIAAYHHAPDGSLIELYSDMDVFVPELGVFEQRAFHEDRPQKPKVWPLTQMSAWHTEFTFDLARG